MTLPIINSHNSWDKLEEVWLGDVYPESWYDHLSSEVKDVFQSLTRSTQHDLDLIQKLLESLGIRVRRPEYTNIELCLYPNQQLKKPEICPRDRYVVIDNQLYVPAHLAHNDFADSPWSSAILDYRRDLNSKIISNFSPNLEFNGANVVRVGRDIVVDSGSDLNYQEFLPNYRVHRVNNGGHMDGCFAILRPGLLLVNNYFDDYNRLFPGWDIIELDHPTYCPSTSDAFAHCRDRPFPHYNGKFWDPGAQGNVNAFNEHVIKYALDWVGMYTETYFELNCLVVDPENVVMLGYNPGLEKELAHRGIKVHWVEFKNRSFWDGGMHCLTVDIRRQSTVQDYFQDPGK